MVWICTLGVLASAVHFTVGTNQTNRTEWRPYHTLPGMVQTRAAALSLADLMEPFLPLQPVEDVVLMKPTDALPASNELNGRLTLLDTAAIRYSVIRDDEGYMA